MQHIKSLIRTIPDFPKPGIQFRDVTTLLMDAQGLRAVTDALAARYRDVPLDMVVGVESRGFILGAPLAVALGKGFVPVRKAGKLPGAKIGVEYALEYGTDRLEIHSDALKPGAQVLMVDDLLATGGTMEAACRLVEQVGGRVASCAFVVELVDLKGRDRLKGYDIHHLVEFEGGLSYRSTVHPAQSAPTHANRAMTINLRPHSTAEPLNLEEAEYQRLVRRQEGVERLRDLTEWLAKLHYLRQGRDEGKLDSAQFADREARLVNTYVHRVIEGRASVGTLVPGAAAPPAGAPPRGAPPRR